MVNYFIVCPFPPAETRPVKKSLNMMRRPEYLSLWQDYLHIYSHAFLPSVLLMMHPVNVTVPNGLLMVFP